VDYLVRLEQGRAKNPSPQVLASLARALRITASERDVLYRSAGVAPPPKSSISSHLSPGLQRIIDRLGDSPVGVYTAAWDFVLSNRLWDALFSGETARSGREANLVWRTFTASAMPVVWSRDEAATFAREMVADLHVAASAYPDDLALMSLISDLRTASPLFLHLWDDWHVGRRNNERKVVNSPTVGLVTLDCDVLATADSDLRLVVYTAQPGSADAEKLELLKVVGAYS